MLRSILDRVLVRSRTHHKKERTRCRLRFETLERRELLTTFAWIADADGNFEVGANWRNTTTNTTGAVPGAADDANLGGKVVTSNVTRAVNTVNGGALIVASGTFTTNNNGSGTSGLNGLVINTGASLRVADGVTLTAGSEINGVIQVDSTATFRWLRGQNTLKTGASLTGAGVFLASGDVFGGPTVTLQTNLAAPTNLFIQNGVLNGDKDLTLTNVTTRFVQGGAGGVTIAGTGKVIVSSGSTLQLGGDAGGVNFSQRTVQNSGTINFNASGDIGLNDGAVLNNLAGANFNILVDRNIASNSAGSVFNNSGTITKSAGVGNTTIFAALNNTNTLNVASGSVAVRGGANLNAKYTIAAGTTLDLTAGGTVEYGGTTTLQGSGTVLTGAGSLTADDAGASFTIPSTISFNVTGGTIVVPINATLTMNGNVNLIGTSEMLLRGGGTWSLNGNANHSGSGTLFIGGDLLTNTVGTTLRIVAARAYRFLTDASINVSGVGGTIVNAGAFYKTGGTGVSSILAPIVNTGAFRVYKGTLSLRTTQSTGGTFEAQANSTLSLADSPAATFTQNGTFTGVGVGKILLATGILRVGNSGATFQIPAGLNFRWTGGAINVPSGVSATVNGNITQAATGEAVLNGGGTLTLNGNVTQTELGHTKIDGDGSTATTLVIAAGRTFAFGNDSGITSGPNGGGTVINNGTLRKTAGSGTSVIATVLTQAANITVDVGTVQLATTGGVVNGGAFNVAAGAVLALTNGTSTTTMAGTFTGSGAGQVRLTGGQIVAAGGGGGVTFNFPSGLFRWSGGTINTNTLDVTIQGNATLAGAVDLNLNGGGSLIVKGSVIHTTTANLIFSQGTTLNIASGATYTIQSDGDFTFNFQSGVIENRGIIRKTGGVGLTTVQIPISNLGYVESRSGIFQFSTISEIVGSTLTGGNWNVASTSTVSAELNFGTAVDTIALGATINLNGPQSSLGSISGLKTVQGNFQLTNGANFTTAGSMSNSGRITLSQTSVLTVAANYFQTSVGRLAPTLSGATLGRIRTQGSVTIGGNLIVTLSGSLPAVGTVLTLIDNGGAAAVSGTFAGLANNATFSIGAGVFKISYFGGTGNDVTLTRMS